jgi:hypothetical protein
MTGEVVNLRIRRKQAARDAGRQAGAEAAARHGLTAAERQRQATEAEAAARRLAGHLREVRPLTED